MTTDNKDNKLSIGSGDYAEILRHAVAVIEHARTEIAQLGHKSATSCRTFALGAYIASSSESW